jgi:hypothetical protein
VSDDYGGSEPELYKQWVGESPDDTVGLFRDDKEAQRNNDWLFVSEKERQRGSLDSAVKLMYSKEMGICRRNPPSIGSVIAESEFAGIGIAYSLFPVIQGGEWCGEYQPQKQSKDSTALGEKS